MRHPVALLLLLGPLLLGPLAGAATAQGAPRSIGDCERIKGDLAYNGCLAMFGPRANVRGGEGGPSAAPPPTTQTAAAAAAETVAPKRSYGRRGRSVRYGRTGRSRAAFTVSHGSRSYRRSRRR